MIDGARQPGLWAKTRVYLGVTLATVIIWLFAEVQSLAERLVETEVQLVSTQTGSLRVRPAEPDDWSGRVKVLLRGSRAALAKAERRLATGFNLSPDNPTVPPVSGVHSIDLKQLLSQDRVLADVGARVVSTEPARLPVRVVRLVTREADVVAVLPDVQVQGEPEFAPARVRLTAPESLLRNIESDIGGAQVFVTPTRTALEALPEGSPQVLAIRLKPPSGLASDPDVTIDPPSVQMTITLRSRLATTRVAPTPIWIAIPPTETQRWNGPYIDGDPFLQEVVVHGPSDLIERIKTREIGVLAVVSLSSDELERGVNEKTVSFALLEDGKMVAPPPNVQFESAQSAVRLKFSRVAPGTPAGGPTSTSPNQQQNN